MSIVFANAMNMWVMAEGDGRSLAMVKRIAFVERHGGVYLKEEEGLRSVDGVWACYRRCS
jgi:uncharacterized protein YrrD